MVGPSFRGLSGSKLVFLDPSGREIEKTVDDAVLVQAIQDPVAMTVKGYPPIMPKSTLPEEDLQKIIKYINTLR
jgi:cytochrome c oxidase subunit 2